MLRSRHIDVTFLVRENAYMDFLFSKEESDMIHREIEAHGIDLRLNTELESIGDDGGGGASEVRMSTGETIGCRFVGLATGVTPRVELAEASDIETNRGILVDRHFRTSAADVYAAGDCAEFRTPLEHGGRIEQLWYSARRQGKTLGRILAGETVLYEEPVFYNSAKFLDLEYQTYGRVPPNDGDGVRTVLWRSADGGRLLRLAHDRTGRITGVNGFGMRLRHDRWAHAIRTGKRAGDIVRTIADYLFNPEFDSAATRAITDDLAPRIEQPEAA
jgi:NADPH-dependent 2,4-dienoyl-CoA reductase/sulfur reductase-like enzyme